MLRWRVDYIGKMGSHLGTVEAPDERSAIDAAAKQFNITPARRNKIVVTKVEDRTCRNGHGGPEARPTPGLG
jgi:hypothetical protein